MWDKYQVAGMIKGEHKNIKSIDINKKQTNINTQGKEDRGE